MLNIAKLSKIQKQHLLKMLLKDEQKENSNGRFQEKSLNSHICPHCKSGKIRKNGVINGTQRFKCMSCNKFYSIKTNTLFQNSNKSLDVWFQYIDLMFEGKSLSQIAGMMNINIKTAFYWRHKILNAFSVIHNEKLSGIVEADETFFRHSKKGCRTLNRSARKRGEKAKKKGSKHKKRGLSNDLVCVACAIDRNKNIFNKSICFGRVQEKALRRNMSHRIKKGSVLVTDGASAYRKFSKSNELELKQLVGKRMLNKKYHIQTINSYHSGLKNWMRIFKGVSTKHLDNYLNFFKIMKKVKGDVFEKCISINNYVSVKGINEKQLAF